MKTLASVPAFLTSDVDTCTLYVINFCDKAVVVAIIIEEN